MQVAVIGFRLSVRGFSALRTITTILGSREEPKLYSRDNDSRAATSSIFVLIPRSLVTGALARACI